MQDPKQAGDTHTANPPKRRAPASDDFLSFMLQSFGDPERLIRLQHTFQKAGTVNGRPFFRMWADRTQLARALETFNGRLIRKCAKDVLLTWHNCSRRAAIERRDFETESLNLDHKMDSSGDSIAPPACYTASGAPVSPREANTHELRIQSLLEALRQARVAERESTARACKLEETHNELAAEMRRQISDLKSQVRSLRILTFHFGICTNLLAACHQFA